MIVLHPWSSDRPEDKEPTQRFVAAVKSTGQIVISRKIDDPMGYPDFLRDHWEKGDALIVLEDDKLPTLEDFYELRDCQEDFCAFPYPFSFRLRTKLEDWTPFPYSLGFVKFSAKAQAERPVRTWYREGKHWGLDKMIEEGMKVHLHPRMIAHNHRPTLTVAAKNYGARKLLVPLGWRPGLE